MPAVLVDTQQRRLPDVWILGAAIVALIARRHRLEHRIIDDRRRLVWPRGAALMAAPLLVLHLVSPPSMGFGDVKLALLLGAAVGVLDWQLAIPALALAAGHDGNRRCDRPGRGRSPSAPDSSAARSSRMLGHTTSS